MIKVTDRTPATLKVWRDTLRKLWKIRRTTDEPIVLIVDRLVNKELRRLGLNRDVKPRFTPDGQ